MNRSTLIALSEQMDYSALASTKDALASYRLPQTQAEALETLAFYASVFPLLALYQHYFGEEYARSNADIVPASDAAYSEREQEFFELVDDRLFPVSWLLRDVLLERDERSLTVEFLPMGREWWNGDLEYWELGWLLLLWLIGEQEQEEELRKRRPDIAQLLAQVTRNKGPVDMDSLEEQGSQVESPLAHLPWALRILFHETGCWYLDAYEEEQHESFDWSVEDMDLLSAQGRRMAEITALADRFIEWLDGDPVPRIMEVIRLWNQSTKPQQQQVGRTLLLIPRETNPARPMPTP